MYYKFSGFTQKLTGSAPLVAYAPQVSRREVSCLRQSEIAMTFNIHSVTTLLVFLSGLRDVLFLDIRVIVLLLLLFISKI